MNPKAAEASRAERGFWWRIHLVEMAALGSNCELLRTELSEVRGKMILTGVQNLLLW